MPAVLKNFNKQTHVNKRLCIVENGEALGACKKYGVVPDLLLTSEKSPSVARNAAFTVLRDFDAYFVMMDDDDIYGPEYLSEHAQHAKRGRIVGKRTHWVLFEGSCLALFRPDLCNKPQEWLIGGSIGGYAREAPEWVGEIDEDFQFCRDFSRKGGEVFGSSTQNLVYVRRTDPNSHTFSVTHETFADRVGPWFFVYPETDTARAFEKNLYLHGAQVHSKYLTRSQ